MKVGMNIVPVEATPLLCFLISYDSNNPWYGCANFWDGSDDSYIYCMVL